ncbi:MAG: hypothetical protein QM755_14085 [Luteolibacter sp.]
MHLSTRHWVCLGFAACLLWLGYPGNARNEYLANALLGVWFLSALTLLSVKLRWSAIPWKILWAIAPAVSWLLLNLALVAEPPDNGFGAMVTFFLGWFYLLPVFGVWVGIYWLLKKMRIRFEGGTLARNLFPSLVGISITAFIVAHFMWTPRTQVEAAARRIAVDQKWGNVSKLQAHRTWAGWTVDLDAEVGNGYPIFFSRAGKVMGWGGG